MNININKDFATEYKDDAVRGLSLKEAVSLGSAAVLAIGIMAGIWWQTRWSPEICVYISIPFALPVIALGFYKYQGMSVIQMLKEIHYSRKTAHLVFEAEEMLENDNFVFSTEFHEITGIQKKRRSGNRKKRKGGNR